MLHTSAESFVYRSCPLSRRLPFANRAVTPADPSLIQQSSVHNTSPTAPYYPTSPASSGASAASLGTARPGSASHRTNSRSPYMHGQHHPYGAYASGLRRPSSSPSQTRHMARGSYDSPPSGSLESDDDGRERGRCPHPECGRVFKDLKAHLLTHLNERPEKCPLPSCEYHHKGFARKYDKNRHTLTHYKGTMVCGLATPEIVAESS